MRDVSHCTYDALEVASKNGASEQEQDRVRIMEILASSRFDINNPPPKAVPIYAINDATAATRGNIEVVQGPSKQGKSSFLSACMASTMEPSGDCLGVTSQNPSGLAVLHFDTEQSPAAHHANVLIALRRAGRAEPPHWLRSYRLASAGQVDRRKAVAIELECAAQDHGGVHSVILDGVADFIRDPNDAGEAFAFVDELHQLAIKYDTVIIAVLHENPGSETGKTRGHLGSQLERKAETNLRLSKDGEGVTVVFADKARHAHIPKEHGSRFVWSDEEQMHVSIAAAAETKLSAKKARDYEFAIEVFRDVPSTVGLTWTEAHKRIMKVGGYKKDGARSRFETMRTANVIRKSGDRYCLSA